MLRLGDTGLIVQYIQNFLKDNYNKDLHLSDVYDKATHKTLIEYMKLPEIMDAFEFKDLLIKTYTLRESQPPNLLINGGGIWNFNFEITPDYITFYNRPNNDNFSGASYFITRYMDDVRDFCKDYGWYLAGYNVPKYNESSDKIDKITFTVKKEKRKQLLPTSDIINMINLSCGDYLLNKCFIDENNAYHGIIQSSKEYMIVYIEAKPGDVFTISHGYKYACEIAIAYSEHSLAEIKTNGYTVNNIVSHMRKSKLGELNPGSYETYRIPLDSDCKYLLVQMPYKNRLISPESNSITVKIGDINQDGLVNKEDLDMLREYVVALTSGNELPFVLSGASLVAANINKDVDVNGQPVIDEKDLYAFDIKYQECTKAGLPIDFGETTYEVPKDESDSNYDRLLIMYGDINSSDNEDNRLNIPIEEFQTNPWTLHDEFIPYLLGSAIHKYSNMNDIVWLQELISKLEPRYKQIQYGYYDSSQDHLTDDKFIWNENKSLFELYRKNNYTGLVMTSTSCQNGTVLYEKTGNKSNIQVINGKWIEDDHWNGSYVLNNGYVTKQLSQYSLKEIIKSFQIYVNKQYSNYSKDSIRFITGYLTPLTEKYLKLYANDLNV